MAPTVVRPMIVDGLRTSIRGSRAARWNSASAEIWTPGQIAPPRYSPFALIASSVVAVPKSTTMSGACAERPNFSYAATLLTMRSAPTSHGLSYRMGMPVLTAGSTVSNGTPKNRSAMATTVGVSGGTTDPRMTPRTWTRSMRLCANRPSTSKPSSSAVRSRSDCNRQLWTSASRSNTPRTMLVLPTSMASSIRRFRSEPLHLAADHALDPIAGLHQERAVVVDACRDARSARGDDARARCRRSPMPPRVENNIEASSQQIVVPASERNERFDQQLAAIGRAPEFTLDRRGAVGEIRRIGRRPDVDAIPEHDRVESASVHGALRENPSHFAPADLQIVGPFQRHRQTAARFDALRNRDAGREGHDHRRAPRIGCARGCHHHRDVDAAPGR